MLYKIALRDMKRSKGIYGIITLLLVVALLVAVALVSAIEVRVKKYSMFADYLKEDGLFFESMRLSYSWNGYDGWAYADEDEIKEMFPMVKDVLSVEEVQVSAVSELAEPVTVWAYSRAITDELSVNMEDGRWFKKSDMDDDMLKAVVTYNRGVINVGDVLTLKSNDCETKYQVEIIGVIGDGESLYYTNPIEHSATGDYRDLYYTYDYETEEGHIIMIMADEQILGDKERYADLNYTFGEVGGFGKIMLGGTIITFKDGTTQEEIEQCEKAIRAASQGSVNRSYAISEMNNKSLEYITEELRIYMPVFVSIIGFLVIAAVSANVITTKKQLKNYAIYYTCGLPWKKCARVSLHIAMLTVIISIALIIISILGLNTSGIMAENGIRLGVWQLSAMLVIGGVYIVLAWMLPLSIVRRASAKEIMTKHK